MIYARTQFREELEFWKKNNKNVFQKIQKLVDSISQHPFEGIGKPEPLKYEFFRRLAAAY